MWGRIRVCATAGGTGTRVRPPGWEHAAGPGDMRVRCSCPSVSPWGLPHVPSSALPGRVVGGGHRDASVC